MFICYICKEGNKKCKTEFKLVYSLTQHLKKVHKNINFIDYYKEHYFDLYERKYKKLSEFLKCYICHDQNDNISMRKHSNFKTRHGLTLHIQKFHKEVNIKNYYKIYYNELYEEFYKEKINFNDYDDYVICELCKKHFKQLPVHLKTTHNISSKQYKQLFPGYRLYSKNVINKIQEKRRITVLSDEYHKRAHDSHAKYLASDRYQLYRNNLTEEQKLNTRKKISDSVTKTLSLLAQTNKKKIYFISKIEKDFLDEIEHYITIKIARQKRIKLDIFSKLLDGFIEIFKIIIEIDGNYWHNYPKGQKKDYDLDDYCSRNKIKIFRIWESNLKNNEKRKKYLLQIIQYILYCQYRYEADNCSTNIIRDSDIYELIEYETEFLNKKIEEKYA